MPELKIRLLGNFQLTYGDTPRSEFTKAINQPRLQALLAYLLLHRRAPQSRRHLAFLFWPDSNEAQALTNLRKLLTFLRGILPESDRFLLINAKIIQWIPDTPISFDVVEFEHAVVQSKTLMDDHAITALQQVIDLYRGDLLPDCFDDWIIPIREALHASFIQALERLTVVQEERRDYPAAIQAAQRLLRHDPLHETTYLRLMRLYALNGDRAAALQVYQTCVTLLQRELGVEPNAAIRAAYTLLLHQETPNELPTKPALPNVDQSPFTGRRIEWQMLQTIWHNVTQGRAHFTLISGEAGIGKTRLAEEMLHWAVNQGIITAKSRTYAAEGRLAYAPLVEWLRTPALKTRLVHLEASCLTELARLLPELLSEQPGLPAPNPVVENWQRHRLFEALTQAILAGRQPLLLVLDDLQWCDQETLEWLHFLLRHDSQAPVLIVGTARPEEIGPRHPLTTLRLGLRNNQQLTELQLTSLTEADTAQLAQAMVGKNLNPTWANQLYRDTEGNPLFVVEMVRAALGRGDEEHADGNLLGTAIHPHSLTPLPSKVQTVIESRLAQLTPFAHKLAELAATIGRNFTFQLLVRASENSEDEVMGGLDELWQQHIVREQSANIYDFSHDKIREVMYEEISATRRRLLHRRIAQALETEYATNLDQVNGQLAAHYEKAGLPTQALSYYQQAAQRSLRIYANHEAIDHFNRGLALIVSMPDHADRSRQELAFLLGLGPALVLTHGYGTLRIHEVYTRAQVLTQQLGEPPNPASLRALAVFFVVRRRYAEAYSQGQEILTLAKRTDNEIDPVLYVEAHYVLGVTAFWRGEFLQAKDHLERAISVYDEQRHNIHIALYSQDPGVICLIRLAHLLWFVGYPRQAQQKCEEALALARKFAHPFSLGYALNYALLICNDCNDPVMAQPLFDETMALSQRYESQYWLNTSLILQWRLEVEHGAIDAGIAQIRAGIRTYEGMQQDLYRPYSLALLAQAEAKAGNCEQGLATLAEALATVNHYGDRWYEAELLRLKGELLDKLATVPSIVEACFQQAYTLAHAQQAKSLEMRAAMSLSRFWQRQGKCEQARRLLTETYIWFTEGFDTADLQEAKALLEALS